MFVTVSISAMDERDFRGVLVQARQVADSSPIGRFTIIDDNTKLSACTPPEVSMQSITASFMAIFFCSLLSHTLLGLISRQFISAGLLLMLTLAQFGFSKLTQTINLNCVLIIRT